MPPALCAGALSRHHASAGRHAVTMPRIVNLRLRRRPAETPAQLNLPSCRSYAASPVRAAQRTWRRLAVVHHPPQPRPPATTFDSFNSYLPRSSSSKDGAEQSSGSSGKGQKSLEDRDVKLGRTLRILQERLPTLLQAPLPPDILSPQIKLHLFPSTHPNLPAVSGRVAYNAALWTSPIAWGRVPLVGNVRLEILSERMIKRPSLAGGSGLASARPATGHPPPHPASAGKPACARCEQLVVRWRAADRGAAEQHLGKMRSVVSGHDAAGSHDSHSGTPTTSSSSSPPAVTSTTSDEFTGLFIFEFDEAGRVLSHVIENTQPDSAAWERQSVGARVMGLTDWLLGGWKREAERRGGPCPAMVGHEAAPPSSGRGFLRRGPW